MWLYLCTAFVFLMIVNVLSQAYEDGIGIVAPATAFYLDWVWYADDILGPGLYIASGAVLILKAWSMFSLFRFRWPVALLGLTFIGIGLGDTVDAHWVVARGAEAADEVVSLTSWISKLLVVSVLALASIYARHNLRRSAADALLFVFVLVWIDQVQFSIALDFAGYAFHVIEEVLEVVTALLVFLLIARPPLEDDPEARYRGA